MNGLVIGASLKMYFGRRRTAEWVRAVRAICDRHPAVVSGGVQPFVVPSFLAIPDAVEVASGSPLLVGAQDMHWAGPGPYTGEVSAEELVEHGVDLVEIGHAERRRLFGETDETAASKVAAAWRAGLTPVLCVGEHREVDAATAAARCADECDRLLEPARDEGLTGGVIVAYEPVWAIGRSEPASEAHIRRVTSTLRERLGADPTARPGRVIYGGSAGPGLLTRIAADVDGLFLGRFVHDPVAFGRILDEAFDLQESA